MTAAEKTQAIVKILDQKKATDIQAIRVRDLTIVADYFVIATGSSTTLVKSLADEVEFQLKQQGVAPARVEGYNSSTWILLDYEDVLVHVFYTEARDYYKLERLWADGEQLDVEALVNQKED